MTSRSHKIENSTTATPALLSDLSDLSDQDLIAAINAIHPVAIATCCRPETQPENDHPEGQAELAF